MKEIKILIPLLEKEMEEVDNLSKPILRVIINSTVNAVLKYTDAENTVETVITQFLVRPDCEENC